MRLLHIYSGNLYGGIETLLVTMARARAACPAIEPEMALCFEGRLSAELAEAGVPVHQLPEARMSRPQTVRRARRALDGVLAGGRFDRVVCHAAWSQAVFGGVVRRADIPLVFWAHDAATGRHWTERLARRTRPDLAICNSRYTADALSRLYSDLSALILTYPIETASCALTAEERAALRHGCATAPDAPVLIQTSRMEAWKGHAVVMEALGRLRDRPGWTWWIVGGAQRPEESAYVETLVSTARRLGIDDRLRWLGERRDVPRLLAAADVHCQANIEPEPFGIAYVEALAAGLPVVASKAGGAIEIVDDTCGVLVPPGDAAALAPVLDRLLFDQDYRAVLAAGARPRARRLSDPATQLAKLACALTAMSPAGAVA